MSQKQQAIELLKQFGQIILHGPPGTGKTRLAFRVAAEVLGVRVDDNQNNAAEKLHNHPQFAIVQFHPAYNYEDFVRGIQVSAVDGQVVYSTDDRVFGKIAKDAFDKPKAPHVIVIDEINRANVSAVLGELIYGLELEYRGKKIQTPYQVKGDAGLIIPRNLSVIGTMNTADRTIGQIDYAVRRRFAFVRCMPDKSVVEKHGGPRAPEFFRLTNGVDGGNGVFEHLSADHDKEDVCIGHSYFLADGIELANNIIYQVVPILREYVKDGVLKRDAEGEIRKILRKAESMGEEMTSVVNTMNHTNALGPWFWEHQESGDRSRRLPLARMILDLVANYANRAECQNLEELRDAFPNKLRPGYYVVRSADDSRVKQDGNRRFFARERERIPLPDGSAVVVCRAWGAQGQEKERFENFCAHVRELGYEVRRNASGMTSCRVVNVGEKDGRSWDENRKFNFWSAGHGQKWADAAKSLKKGEVIFVYLNKDDRTGIDGGYVGAGIVVEQAQPIGDFVVDEGEHKGKRLVDCVKTEFLKQNLEDPANCEWAVRVMWHETRDRENAAQNIPRYRGTVKRVTNRNNIRALEVEFNIPIGDGKEE